MKMEFLKRSSLLAVVFLTGAAVLVIELLALRLLSPYFGNTIFTASSVITVILAALSFGYYWGGHLADRHPKPAWFFSLIGASGLNVLFLTWLYATIIPPIALSLSMRSGPLIITLVLFFFPALLLGMLSPFAIKLQSTRRPDMGIGQVSGAVFFWSTAGSITGSLLTGFVFVPHFGLQTILLSTGVFLVVLGFLPLVCFYRPAPSVLGAWGALALVLGTLLHASSSLSPLAFVHQENGLYESIAIFDTEYKGQPTRILLLDRSSSAGMNMRTGDLAFDYARYYQLYELLERPLSQALVIGGGGYLIPKFLHVDYPQATIDVLEIEPALYALSQQYFQVPSTEKIRNIIADGRRYLHENDTRYDLIFGDAYHALYSVPTHLCTREFFDSVATHLTSEGLFVFNVIGQLSKQAPDLLMSLVHTARQSFPHSYLFATQSTSSPERQNFVFVGSQQDLRPSLNRLSKQRDPFWRRVHRLEINIDALPLDQQIIFTDNYAPIDYLATRIIP